MKKALPIIAILGLALSGAATVFALNPSEAKEVKAATGPVSGGSLPTSITLRDNTDDEIRSYYSSLNSLSASERQGTNLLKNLRTIIHDLTYYSYANCWKIYEITDREWTLSPAEKTEYGTYNASTQEITNYQYGSSASNAKNNPYLHDLYKNRDENGVTLEAARLTAWEGHGTLAGGTDREHVWCQSRGFKASNGANGPAGTDVHHLMAGDSRVNQTLHNNNPYGFVDENKSTVKGTQYLSYLDGNLNGSPLHPHSGDEADTVVFEPQDSDKGDIARACFYMAACYNNYSGSETITQYDPNLIMADYATSNGASEASSASHPVAMGILSDLLEWHKLDPVDEFEIHRNNLIYNNYQHNRNPFIDFPEWADYIWGTSTNVGTPTGSANPANDVINDKQTEPTPTPSSSETTSSSEEVAATIAVTGIPSDGKTIEVGETFTLSATSSDGGQIKWTTSDSSILKIEKNQQVKAAFSGPKRASDTLTVDSGESILVTVLKNGKATLTCQVDGQPSTAQSFAFQVGSFIPSWLIYVAIGVVAVVLIVVLVVVLSSKKGRKEAAKAVKKGAKRIVKKSSKKSSRK